MNYSEKTAEIHKRYMKRMMKRLSGKPAPIRIIMDRTYHSAIWVLELLDGMSMNELISGVDLLSEELGFERKKTAVSGQGEKLSFGLYLNYNQATSISIMFRAQLELAIEDQDRFVFGLHSFYNDLAAYIKREQKGREFADLLGMIMKIQYAKRETVEERIVFAYINLFLQALEYLRPNKFDLDVFVCGIDTHGEFLTAPYPLAYSDLPAMDIAEKMEQGWQPSSRQELFDETLAAYARHGMELKSAGDLIAIETIQRIHINTTAALFPFINETTFDIIPKQIYADISVPLQKMTFPFDVSALEAALQCRTRALPPDGVAFSCDDTTGEIKGLFLREVTHHDEIYCLYRLDLAAGGLAGYYEPGDGTFFAVARETDDLGPYYNAKALVLALYASQVTDTMPLHSIELRQSGFPVRIHVIN